MKLSLYGLMDIFRIEYSNPFPAYFLLLCHIKGMGNTKWIDHWMHLTTTQLQKETKTSIDKLIALLTEG
jgi:hypothetical protein